jgi:hypothetical protein
MKTTERRPYRCNEWDHAVGREERIQWLGCSPEQFEYVREVAFEFPFRQRLPRRDRCSGRMVAIAVLRPDAPAATPGMFLRRCWWVASHDPYEGSGHPCEAVDPCSIRPGKLSLESDR